MQKKKVIKRNTSKKEEPIFHEGILGEQKYREDWRIPTAPPKGGWLKDSRGKVFSMVEQRHGKCAVRFEVWPGNNDTIDEDVGFIAVLALNGITGLTARDVDPEEELIYEFDKKYTKKIKLIEKAYFLEKIQVDARLMSLMMASIINITFPSPGKMPDRRKEDLEMKKFLKSRKLK